MQTPTPRRIVVDDADPGIVYSSSFFVNYTQGSQDENGNFGPIFGSTLHGTNSNGNFQYTFSGTQIFVYGTISGDMKDPTWECFIDQISIHRTPALQFAENNWLLCLHQNLIDGPHNLTVTVTSNGHTFWFDYLQYTPSTSVPLDNALIRVDCTDGAIRYNSVWVTGNGKSSTITPGAGAIFSFVGTQLQWYSTVSTGATRETSYATYSVDYGSDVLFALPRLPSSSNITQYNQLLFQTLKLPLGTHTVHVTLENTSSTPLELTYLLVQNETQSIDGNSTSQTASLPTAMSTPHSNANITTTKSNAGSIAGGLLGSVLFLLSIIAAYFFYQHYKRARLGDNPKSRERTPIPFYPQRRPNYSGREATNTVPAGFGISPGPQPSQIDPLRSHRRRQSHGQHNNATPTNVGTSQAPVSERIDEATDERTPYYGGYQTWGQAKAMEAKSHRHRQRDSYI